MKNLSEYLVQAVKMHAADVFLIAGGPVSYRVDGQLQKSGDPKLTPDDTDEYIHEIYALAGRDQSKYRETGDDDFSFAIPELARFRVNTLRQRGSKGAILRVVAFNIPDYQQINIPDSIMDIANDHHGIVLFTGVAGSGKSTTQACIIDRINTNRPDHIITLEDPIEFLHSNKMGIVTQREMMLDTHDYLSALRACLRQSPDVIQVGEMRDYETMRTAMTAAETGHLIMATMHTDGSVNAIDRVIDSFPAAQQAQVRVQLAAVLKTIVSQKLLPAKDGGRVPAFEILQVNDAVRTLIREGKTHQIDNVISTSASEGMITMDGYIYQLFTDGLITAETAVTFSNAPELMNRKVYGN